MTMPRPQNLKQCNTKLPEALMKRMKRAAKKDRRSMVKWMAVVLEVACDASETPTEATQMPVEPLEEKHAAKTPEPEEKPVESAPEPKEPLLVICPACNEEVTESGFVSGGYHYHDACYRKLTDVTRVEEVDKEYFGDSDYF